MLKMKLAVVIDDEISFLYTLDMMKKEAKERIYNNG